MPKNWNHLLFPKLAENTESPYFSRKKCRCYFDRRKTGCFTYTRRTHSKEIIKRFIPHISGLKWEENRRRMLTWAQWSLFGALASSWSTRLSQNDVTLNWNMIRIGLFQYFFLYFFSSDTSVSLMPCVTVRVVPQVDVENDNREAGQGRDKPLRPNFSVHCTGRQFHLEPYPQPANHAQHCRPSCQPPRQCIEIGNSAGHPTLSQ